MMPRFVPILVIPIVLSLSFVESTFAQEQPWQRVAPLGQSFTILMPSRANEALRRVSVSERDWIPARAYYSLVGGRRYLVAVFLKTTSNTVPALSSYENFIQAMEEDFKRDKIAKSMTFERDVALQGVAGRQYHIKLGKYSGVARFLGTDKAFYALMVVGAQESDSDVARFLSSFALGEENNDAHSSGVIVNTVTLVGSAPADGAKVSPPPDRTSVTTLPPEPWDQPIGPITGGVLNGKAISLAVPEYPKAAQKAHDSGVVIVRILIDEFGNVINAEALDGPHSLRDAAVAAAWKSRFTPTRLMGQPVRVNGVILYNFGSPK